MGDSAALTGLLHEFTPRLLLFIRRIGGQAIRADVDAEDLLQETLCRVHHHLPEFQHRGPGSFYRWIAAIARHVVQNRLDYLRRKGRGDIRHIESAGVAESASARSPEASTPATSPSGYAVRHEEVDRLHLALAVLPPPLREVIELRMLEGLSFAETAAKLGIPKATVFDRFRSGMALLGKMLDARRSTDDR